MKRTKDLLQHLAIGINRKVAPRGFVLLTFNMDNPDGTNVNYVSNAERASMIIAMKEVVARLEGRVIETDTVQ